MSGLKLAIGKRPILVTLHLLNLFKLAVAGGIIISTQMNVCVWI